MGRMMTKISGRWSRFLVNLKKAIVTSMFDLGARLSSGKAGMFAQNAAVDVDTADEVVAGVLWRRDCV